MAAAAGAGAEGLGARTPLLPASPGGPGGIEAAVNLNVAWLWNAEVTWKMGEMIKNTEQRL